MDARGSEAREIDEGNIQQFQGISPSMLQCLFLYASILVSLCQFFDEGLSFSGRYREG